MKKWFAVFCVMLFFVTTATPSAIFEKDPISEARRLISDLYNKPSTLRTSTASAGPLSLITSERISVNTTLSQEQVCFGKGDFAGASLFRLDVKDGGERILYAGKESIHITIAVMCDWGRVQLIDSLRNSAEIPEEGLPTCNLCSDDETCCAFVFLKNSEKQDISKIVVYEGNIDQLLEAENSNKFIVSFLLPLIAVVIIVIIIALIFWKIKIGSVITILWIIAVLNLLYAVLIIFLSMALFLLMFIPIILTAIFWKITKTKLSEKKKRLIAIFIFIIDLVYFVLIIPAIYIR